MLDDAPLADDLLRGIQQIAEFIDETEQRTASLCAQQIIPAGRLGYQWIASKRRIREHYAALTSGGAAGDAPGLAASAG